MIAAVAGAESLQPPSRTLGSAKRPGASREIGAWMETFVDDFDALIVSLEMLGYGGLVGSRTTLDSPWKVLSRLRPLDAVRQKRKDLQLYGSSVVLRASDSYSDAEEPEYWSEFGRELHAFGAELHRRHNRLEDGELEQLRANLPAEIRSDFLRRRIRNHIVNLEALRLLESGVLDLLLLTSDDTAVHSAGSLEQGWLADWVFALGREDRVLIYPGADELGSTLTARALPGGPVSFCIRCVEPDGLERVAKFENVPVRETVVRQIAASGGTVEPDPEVSDVILLVHAPSPVEGDWFGGPPADPDGSVVAAVASQAGALVDAGEAVALADVRYTNGADPWLVDALRSRMDLLALTAYAGWNTAANTLGTVVAHAAAVVRARREGTFVPNAHRRLLAHRLLEDCAYQTVVRPEVPGVMARGDDPVAFIATELARHASRILPEERIRIVPATVRLPWQREFEIDFELALE
jgi:hypothetical protein